MRFIIVSLIGIPASGKSTISMKIHKLSKESLLNANVIVLNFDELIRIDFTNITDGEYKKSREGCFVKIENLIEKLKNQNVTDWMGFIATSELSISKNLISLNCTNTVTLLIIDDNMYYRSMRQRARQICRSHDCEHFQIFMNTSLNDAIERNSRRDLSTVVDRTVIEKMFADLEVPENPRTISIKLENLDEGKFLVELYDRIKVPETLTEEHRKECQEQSIIHEMDLITRKEIGNKMQEVRMKKNLRQLSEKMNIKRKKFMEDVRSGRLNYNDLNDFRIEFRKVLDED